MHSISGSGPGLLDSARRACREHTSHWGHYLARLRLISTADCKRFPALCLWHRPCLIALAGICDPAADDLRQQPAVIHGDVPAALLSSAMAMAQR